MLSKNILELKTIKELKAAGYISHPIKDEMRKNLLAALKKNENPFEGIYGFEDSVIPELQTAILSRHNIILLGLRGQAKTRLARLLINLLDEFIPIVKGSEILDDPFNPISKFAKDRIEQNGDDTEIEWIHRSHRFTEKLATPDVTTADLIGDIDPIKAANLKLPYSDERVIHFGLIPRSNRSIFVINELPDLQPRIQVALFNILQEEDVQIRGFKIRLPLDLLFVFTANPEDYTNRGSIVTPLKDRIDSQILTHYPKNISTSKQISLSESRLSAEQKEKIIINPLVEDLLEQIAFEARASEYVDSKSGVSARLTISARENIFSAAERRMIINGEAEGRVRISDLFGVIPSITGKIELVYEGEQEGPAKVAHILIGKAIRTLFTKYFPSPEKTKAVEDRNLYKPITDYFSKKKMIDLMLNLSDRNYKMLLHDVTGLKALAQKFQPEADEFETLLFMEFLLFGLAEFSLISRLRIEERIQFSDLFSTMFSKSKSDDSNIYEEEDLL